MKIMIKTNQTIKYLERLLKNKVILSFITITIIGLILRIHFIFNLDIFTDEVFYVETARINSFGALLTHNFWIKDHGISYLVFLKLGQFLTTDIVFLRLSNIFIYLLINFSLFFFARKIRNDFTSFIPVTLFSFLPYFVFISVYVSIYNFVILFSVLAFISISRFILFEEKNSRIYLFSFVIFLTLAFYSDYSSIYLYLSLISALVFTYFFKIEKFTSIFHALLLNFIFIFPGLLSFLNNLSTLKSLNASCCLASSQFVNFFPDFLYYIFFRINFIPAFFILIFMIVSLLIYYLKSKNEIAKYLALYTGIGFLSNFTFLYFINRYFLPLLVERTFFMFNFLIILFAYFLFFCARRLTKIHILFILILIFLIIWRFFQNPVVYGNFPDGNIPYRDLITNLIKNENVKNINQIIFLDKNYAYYPLHKYYFLGFSNYMKKNIIEDFKDKKYFIARTVRVLNYYSKKNNNQLFILFYTKYFDLNEFKQEIKINNVENTTKIIYFLDCNKLSLDCKFKKLSL